MQCQRHNRTLPLATISFSSRPSARWAALTLASVAVATLTISGAVQGAETGTTRHVAANERPTSAPIRESTTPRPLDRTGKKRVGDASYYAKMFNGRKMADGTRMDPHDDNAASKTLPLGTKAKVTNLETGKSAVVTIQDRGPYVKGRIVDLSPSTAEKIGITKNDGVAKVEVAPIAVPLPDGSMKPGAATAEGAAAIAADSSAPR
jgi:rare lipoprotein A